MINEEDLIEVNKRFDSGVVVNKLGLEFTVSSLKNSKDWIKQLAYLARAILVDHIFQEGNKRTATAVIVYFFESNKAEYDPYKIDKIIVEIAKKNIESVEQIKRKLKDAIR